MPRRALFPDQPQHAQRQQPGDAGAGHREEHRIELQHGQAGGGQRAAEDQHSDKTVEPAARGLFPARILQA